MSDLKTEILSRLKILIKTIKEDSFKRAFDEFFKWVNYDGFFFGKSIDKRESNTIDPLFVQDWDIQKGEIIGALTIESIKMNKTSSLLDYLREKSKSLSGLQKAILNWFEAQILLNYWDIGNDTQLDEEIYMMIEEEAHRLEMNSVDFQDIPVLAKLREVFLRIEQVSGKNEFTMVHKIKSKMDRIVADNQEG